MVYWIKSDLIRILIKAASFRCAFFVIGPWQALFAGLLISICSRSLE